MQIYLDNNSTTPIDPVVAEAMYQCRLEGDLNPASQHRSGQSAKRKLDEIRDEILNRLGAQSVGMTPDQLILTSGGTESNNLAIIGLAYEPDGSKPSQNRIILSRIEHPSIVGAAVFLEQNGFQVDWIDVEKNGMISISHLEELLTEPCRLVSVMAANNETGVIQPVQQVSQLCQKVQCYFHTDAVQVVGKLPIDFCSIGCDVLTFTSHKFHGPRGIGGLIARNHLQFFPLMFGGFQQRGFRPGTEDTALAMGCLEALRQATDQLQDRQTKMQTLRDLLQSQIYSEVSNVNIIGAEAPRLPHTLNISFKDLDRQEILMAADLNGIAISTGSACASGSSDPSPVLVAMGLDKSIIEGAIRISLSSMNTESEIELAASRIINIINDLRQRKRS
ncbi:MAG: cysteine desulfurase family protein [Planctomycetota bacterium]